MSRPTEEELGALQDALGTFWYFKEDLARWLETACTEHRRLITDADYSQQKRAIAREIVGRMREDPRRYRALAATMIERLSSVDREFPDLRRVQKRYPSKTSLIEDAQAAFDRVAKVVASVRSAEPVRSDLADLTELRTLYDQYAELSQLDDRSFAGKQLEALLLRLFELYGLDPNGAYSLKHEQIDGSFCLDSTHYLLEVKWWNRKLEEVHIAHFAAKVERKLKNTRGLYFSIGGFTEGAIEAHRNRASPLIFFDGKDLHDVLDARISLTTALRAKVRHAAEFGEPYYSTRAIIGAMWAPTD